MGCECKFKPDLNQHAFLGGVLGIDVNGERQPISADGIVELEFEEGTFMVATAEEITAVLNEEG